MTPLSAEFLQAHEIINYHPVPGDGVRAPGRVTLTQWGGQWATHFYNEQDGGFHHGHYFNNLTDAEVDFAHRLTEYAPVPAAG
ncbi:hypothetical protein QUA41_27785 [Microcoleus sp. Pol11C1]